MNKSKFDTVIKNRGNERAAAKIKEFQNAILAAGERLFPGQRHNLWNHGAPFGLLKNVLSRLVSSEPNKDWPVEIWNVEEAAVEKELLATMDEMSKALIAPAPSADGPQPQSPAPIKET